MHVLAVILALAACERPSAALEGEAPAREQGQRHDAGLRMPVARATHGAAVARDGRVLLIGGCVAESCEGGPESATVDAYDPRTGRFASAGRLVSRRISPAAIALHTGEVLIAGGWSGFSVTPLVEIFDPATGKSRRLADLSVARADIAAVRLADGRVLLAGGYDGAGPLALVELFDPKTSTLSPAGALSVPRAGAAAALLANGTVLLAGGAGAGLRPTAAAEIFDPAVRRSAPVGSLAEARYKHAAVALPDGRVLVIGGSDARDSRGKLRSIESFDPATRTFRPAGTMLEPRYKIANAVQLLPGGKVLIAGGGVRAELYDPATRRSTAVGPDFGAALNFATASLLPDGSVLVAGGYGERGIAMSARAWRFRP